jgi:iron complex outermembrane receptor protein
MTRLMSRPARRLMTGVSLFTLCAAALPALAQQQSSSDQLQEVVVTGQRAALEAAQNRKEQAQTILDSISADDAGKLPDESVTEVLQRVPGVAIAHFETLGPQIDTNHYNAQGSNLTIRGMSEIASFLNGQNSFSANGGRALSFEDIPPELLSAMDVYKSSTADLIEGGIGGSIDLRTKMPFDNKGATAVVTAKGNYGDFAKKGEPGGSVLLSDRWNTGIGEVGALIDVAYSDYARRSDQIEIEPYFPQTVGGQNVLIPNGFDWGTNVSDVKRLGAYEALQWRPNNNLEFWQTGFRSDYWSTEYDDITLQNSGSDVVTAAAGATNKFSNTGALISSNDLTSTAWDPIAPGGQAGFVMAGDAGKFWFHNVTTDLSEGVKWNPSEQLQVTSSFQYAWSQSQTYRQELFSAGTVPNYGLDLSGAFPQITIPNASILANPANYTWYNWMDHQEQHLGQEFAWQGDADYDISESSFLRSVKVVLRVASQTEKDDVSKYNWIGLSPIWDPQKPFTSPTTPASYVNINNFSNFFRGQVAVPGTVVFPSQVTLDGYPGNLVSLEQMFSPAGTTPLQPVSYDAGSLSHQSTDTEAIYAMARFGDDGKLLGIPFNGNFGVRVVHDSNSASGAIGYGSTTVLVGTQVLNTTPNFVPNSGGRNFTVALPSFNIQFLPTDQMHVRFAAYQGMSNPTFANLNPSGYYGLTTNTFHQITGASGSGLGNPNLKPMMADELDTSLEYYFDNGGQAHAAAFYKKLHDFITYGTETVNLPFQFTNGTSMNQNVAITQWMNTSKATIEGAEIGWQQFFKFLPDPFDGFGVDFNYTYTSSESPGDLSYDMYGNRIHGLPVDFLSRDTINITGMYSKGPVDVRLAYTWRSKYLLNPSGISGTYTNTAGQSVTYSLPQYNDAYGQLDASVAYRITPDITFQIQAVNLANSVNKVLMGYGQEQFGHAWYMTDRRYEGILSAKF